MCAVHPKLLSATTSVWQHSDHTELPAVPVTRRHACAAHHSLAPASAAACANGLPPVQQRNRLLPVPCHALHPAQFAHLVQHCGAHDDVINGGVLQQVHLVDGHVGVYQQVVRCLRGHAELEGARVTFWVKWAAAPAGVGGWVGGWVLQMVMEIQMQVICAGDLWWCWQVICAGDLCR